MVNPNSLDPCPSPPSLKNPTFSECNPSIISSSSSAREPQIISSNRLLFISDHILAMSIECWCLTLYFFGCQNSGMVLLCSSFLSVGFYLYGAVGCVFIGFQHKDHQKRKGKSENIGRPYKYLTYT